MRGGHLEPLSSYPWAFAISMRDPFPVLKRAEQKGKVSASWPGTGVRGVWAACPRAQTSDVAKLGHSRVSCRDQPLWSWGRAGPLLSPNCLAQGALLTCDSQVPWPRACCKLS